MFNPFRAILYGWRLRRRNRAGEKLQQEVALNRAAKELARAYTALGKPTTPKQARKHLEKCIKED